MSPGDWVQPSQADSGMVRFTLPRRPAAARPPPAGLPGAAGRLPGAGAALPGAGAGVPGAEAGGPGAEAGGRGAGAGVPGAGPAGAPWWVAMRVEAGWPDRRWR